jgi:hypothetical protein
MLRIGIMAGSTGDITHGLDAEYAFERQIRLVS